MKTRFILMPLVLLFFSSFLMAETITLRSDVEFSETGGTITLAGTLTNEGDELADNLRLTLDTPFGESQHFALGHLDPDCAVAWEATYEHPAEQLQGSFVAVAQVAYQDANGYPLDSLFFFPYELGETQPLARQAALVLQPPVEFPPDPKGEGSVEQPVQLSTTGKLRLSIVPLSDREPPASLRVILPDSLTLVAPAPVLNKLPDSTKVFEITVSNRTALAGSRIPVAAVLEITEEGVSHSVVAEAAVDIGGQNTLDFLDPESSRLPLAVPVVFLLVWIVFSLKRGGGDLSIRQGRIIDATVLVITVLSLARHLAVPDWFRDTLAVGGDTPAHHYLVMCLRESLSQGRLVSWAPGWWCGFPAFQYYFPLPYLFILLLNVVFPYNIAFKLGSIAGLFIFPFSAYFAGRLLRLRRPMPALLALVTLPQLLDTTHTMWGVNIYSTLAGMISNSYSFALFPLALASTLRDVLDRMPRILTVILIVLVLLSHFFTSIILVLLVSLLFASLLVFARRRQSRSLYDAALTLIPIGGLAFLLMAWWLIPLVATRPWSVDFGEQWQINILRNLPLFVRWTWLPSLAFVVWVLFRKPAFATSNWRVVATSCTGILILALVLFFTGRFVSEVFVNCRLWPFIIYSLLSMAALAAGAIIQRSKAPVWGVATFAALVLSLAWDTPNQAVFWARHNYRGLESLREGPVFDQLADALRGTPGRVAADLHPGNEQLGSSRIFEALPFRCGKPFLEGGLVNSAIGSLAAYSIQGEISDNPAGWPLLVKPRQFDPYNGLRHLELLGVTHFIARSSHVQEALQNDADWKLTQDAGKWQLYSSTIFNGELVRIWNDALPFCRTSQPQSAMVRWFEQRTDGINPTVLVLPGQPDPPQHENTENRLKKSVAGSNVPPGSDTLAAISRPVSSESQSNNRISFNTDSPGQPHYIPVSYFPNWKVRGADRIYCAAPGGMVVYPNGSNVELYFGRTPADMLGNILTLAGLIYLALWLTDRRRSQPE